MTFEEKVLEVLDENSGGIKLTELVQRLMFYHYQGESIFSTTPTDGLVMQKLEQMEKDDKIGLFNYPYPLGKGVIREKTFVHLASLVGASNEETSKGKSNGI